MWWGISGLVSGVVWVFRAALRHRPAAVVQPAGDSAAIPLPGPVFSAAGTEKFRCRPVRYPPPELLYKRGFRRPRALGFGGGFEIFHCRQRNFAFAADRAADGCAGQNQRALSTRLRNG